MRLRQEAFDRLSPSASRSTCTSRDTSSRAVTRRTWWASRSRNGSRAGSRSAGATSSYAVPPRRSAPRQARARGPRAGRGASRATGRRGPRPCACGSDSQRRSPRARRRAGRAARPVLGAGSAPTATGRDPARGPGAGVRERADDTSRNLSAGVDVTAGSTGRAGPAALEGLPVAQGRTVAAREPARRRRRCAVERARVRAEQAIGQLAARWPDVGGPAPGRVRPGEPGSGARGRGDDRSVGCAGPFLADQIRRRAEDAIGAGSIARVHVVIRGDPRKGL